MKTLIQTLLFYLVVFFILSLVGAGMFTIIFIILDQCYVYQYRKDTKAEDAWLKNYVAQLESERAVPGYYYDEEDY